MDIEKRLKKLRNILNLSTSKMADELKVKDYKIRDCENGKQKISNDLLEKIGISYNVNLNWLISGTGEIFQKNEINYKNEIIKIIEELKKEDIEKAYYMLKAIIK